MTHTRREKIFAWLLGSLLAAALPAGSLVAQTETPPPAVDAQATTPANAAPTNSVAPEPSEAEQITRLERNIAKDAERLARLREEIVGPMSEYRLAEADFKFAEEQFNAKTAELIACESEGNSEGVAIASKQLEELRKKRNLARERFDLAIQTRKTLQEQIAALEDKNKHDRQALDKLTGTASVPAPAPAAPPTVAAAEAAPPAEASPPPPSTAMSLLPLPKLEAEATSAPPEASGAPGKPASKELAQAQSAAQIKKEEALVAEREAQSVSDRIAALDRDIELENKLLVAARKKSDNAFQTAQTLEEEQEARAAAGASPEELRQLRAKRRETQERFRVARAEVRERMDALNEMQTQRAELQREELAAVTAAQQKTLAADAAERVVAQLQNPFAAHNVLQWLLDHGPKVMGIVATLLVLRLLLSLVSHRIVSLMIRRGARGTAQEREDRAKTLVGVFHNAASVTIVIGGLMMICEEVGIAVGPLMGGAAVLGLAVAFGAQNLIRDYFYGFVILLENQFKLNDVLRIGDIAGQVEQITLRMTVLRDQEGNVHFIPNGKIDSVTNMTHGWARAVMEINVTYGENIDRMMALLLEIGHEMRADPALGTLILGDPEMLGVERLGESAVTLKVLLKTRPLSKWPVRREFLLRVKRRFDQLGIEIPYPRRTLLHRYEDTGSVGLQDWPQRKSA